MYTIMYSRIGRPIYVRQIKITNYKSCQVTVNIVTEQIYKFIRFIR